MQPNDNPGIFNNLARLSCPIERSDRVVTILGLMCDLFYKRKRIFQKGVQGHLPAICPGRVECCFVDRGSNLRKAALKWRPINSFLTKPTYLAKGIHSTKE